MLYVLDLAEIPTFQAGRIDAEGLRAADRLATPTSTVGGQPARLVPLGQALAHPPGAGGLRTTRLEVVLAGPQLAGAGARRLPRRELRRPHRLEGDRGRRAHAEPQRRAPRLSEGHALEPARRDVGVTREVAPARGADVAPALSSGKSLQAPDRIADSGFASLVGRSHLSLLVILASLAAALFWGAAHALSPGHGKTIVTAYLVGQRGTPRHAALLGLIVTITHTIGVFGARARDARALAVHRPRPALPVAEPRLGPARRRRSAPRCCARAGGTAGTATTIITTTTARQGTSFRSLFAVGVSGGLLPCPSALVVLLAAISLHRVAFGLLLILAFSAGLALTITGIGLAAVLARSGVPPRLASKAGWCGCCPPPARS